MARNAIYPPSVKPGIPREWPLPNGWTWTPLADVIEVVERPATLADDSVYQLVNAKRNRGGIVARDRLAGRDILTKSQFFVKAGDFVISRRQIIHGACGVAPEGLDGAVVSNEYATLRTRRTLEPEYLRLLSQTPYFQMTCFQSSVGVDVEKMVFKLDDWMRFRVPLPPTDEQRRIAAVLQAADDAVAAAEAVINQTEKVKRGLVEQLLTRGMPGRHARFKMTEIGEVPESWEVLPLEQVVSGTRPITYGIVQAGPHIEGGVPYIRVSDMSGRRLSAVGMLRTSPEIATQYKRSTCVAGDIVFALRGRVGDVKVLPPELDGANLTQGTARVAPGEHMASPFLLWALRSGSIADQTRRAIKGSTFKEISLGALRKLLVPAPSPGEQAEIVGHLSLVEQVEDQELEAKERAHVVRSGLMAELLSGSVRVPA